MTYKVVNDFVFDQVDQRSPSSIWRETELLAVFHFLLTIQWIPFWDVCSICPLELTRLSTTTTTTTISWRRSILTLLRSFLNIFGRKKSSSLYIALRMASFHWRLYIAFEEMELQFEVDWCTFVHLAEYIWRFANSGSSVLTRRWVFLDITNKIGTNVYSFNWLYACLYIQSLLSCVLSILQRFEWTHSL